MEFFAGRVALQFDLVRIMDQPVKNAVGLGWVADLLMPALDRDLAGEDRRVQLVGSSQISRKSRRSVSAKGALAQSSTTSRSILAKRARKLIRLPSARAKAKSSHPLALCQRHHCYQSPRRRGRFYGRRARTRLFGGCWHRSWRHSHRMPCSLTNELHTAANLEFR